MSRIITHKTHESGIALGGIGTGSVELYPDGEFHQWQIYNPPRWASCTWDQNVDDGERCTGDLAFWVRTESRDGAVVVRRLGMRTSTTDFTHRMFGWNRPVAEIEMDGRFPLCDMTYRDPGLPCGVQMRAVAPFVPHDYQASAMPGFFLEFTVENPTEEPMDVSLLGILDPTFRQGGGCRNVFFSEGRTVYVSQIPREKTNDPACGEICLSCEGSGEESVVLGEFSRYMREYVANSDYGVTQESILFDFRRDGCLPDSRVCEMPCLKTAEELAELTDEALEVNFHRAAELPSGQSVLRRLRHLRPKFPRDRAEILDFLKNYRLMMLKMGAENPESFGASALCRKLCLMPGERAKVRFTLSWFFPNHCNPDGKRLGHNYENYVSSALEAGQYLNTHRESIVSRASVLAGLLYDTSMPEMYPDSWSTHLSTVVKSSWWLKDGSFGLWEGLGYCGFHTTDISYQATFGLTALFPELQLRQMAMTAAFQKPDGRVPHFFAPDLNHVDDGFDRVDMNMQYVLMVARDYLMTGREDYLRAMWPAVCSAMTFTAGLDADGDGLPDRDTRRNTYDSWNFSGTPSYIAVLYLAALRAAAFLADRLEEPERAAEWEKSLKKASASLDEKLWNGEYYDLWRDADRVDGSLMTDQVDGEWFLRMIGLPGNLSDERIGMILERVMQHNFDPEAGLINASCPDGHLTTLATYRNCQAGACWTGIGYLTAALAISVGKPEISHKIVETIGKLHEDLGMIWNHWECGFRYTRPLSSFTTLMAMEGVTIDRARNVLCILPRAEGRYPIFVGELLGSIDYAAGSMKLEAAEGCMHLRFLTVPADAGSRLRVNGEDAVCTTSCQDDQITFDLGTVRQIRTLTVN